jgi:ubiquitin-conjugating enzyme E2 J2
MASEMAVRRLRRELKALHKSPMKNPTIVAVPNESNILEWHYVLEGVQGTPYEGGYYHGKLVFPKEYPLKPPSVLMLTPSGRFTPNRRLCLSMSDFHPETWNPMWSVSTILTGLYSFFIETSPTMGSIETTSATKRKLARQSLAYNVKDKHFCDQFPHYVQIHEEKRKALIESGEATHESLLSEDAALSSDNDSGPFYALATFVVAILSVGFALRWI